MSIFGPLLSSSDVTSSVITHLKAWLPAYIAEVERQQQLDPRSIPLPRSYTSRTTPTRWKEEQTPAVIVVCPGISGEPSRDGEGVWRAPWGIGIAVVAAARDQEATQRVSRLYAVAIRALLLQIQPVPNVDGRMRWIDEDYTDIPDSDGRSLAAARLDFELVTPVAVNDQAGPWPGAAPPEDPYEPPEGWHTIQETHLTVTPLED